MPAQNANPITTTHRKENTFVATSPTRFFDPSGTRYGIPTYPWGWVHHFDTDLGTKAQLRKEHLSIAGLEVAAQIMWVSARSTRRDGIRTAALYRPSLARKVRPMTVAQQRALNRAHLARHTCSGCGHIWDFYLPTGNGRMCPDSFGCAASESLVAEFEDLMAVAA